MEGFGQTESTLMIGNLVGAGHKIGSMGRPVPALQGGRCWTPTATARARGHSRARSCVRSAGRMAAAVCSRATISDEERHRRGHGTTAGTTPATWRGRDEDGYYWYVGRADDVIKSSGYRIGPFEIESVIMELPYVLECGVSAAPDEVRGQVVKASIVLTKGTEPTEELKKEIQTYVKEHTAPYKYPRIVVFRDSLPKTTSGKIQRSKL